MKIFIETETKQQTIKILLVLESSFYHGLLDGDWDITSNKNLIVVDNVSQKQRIKLLDVLSDSEEDGMIEFPFTVQTI